MRYLIPLLLLASCRHHIPPHGFAVREPEPSACWASMDGHVFRPVLCEEGK